MAPFDINGLLITTSSLSSAGLGGIVTDGLVLHLDAGYKHSYPMGGTTWYDLDGSNSGTLTNGPTYSTEGGGSINFDGSNDYVSMANNTALNTQTPTVEVWIKTDNLNRNGFWFEKGSVNTQYSLFQEGTNIVWRQKLSTLSSQYTLTANYLTTSNWAHIVGTFTSGNRRTYINGNLVTSDSQTGTIDTNNTGMYVGAYGTGTGYFYDGKVAAVRVYNRNLSTPEIQQNYNATKGRFGL